MCPYYHLRGPGERKAHARHLPPESPKAAAWCWHRLVVEPQQLGPELTEGLRVDLSVDSVEDPISGVVSKGLHGIVRRLRYLQRG